MRAPDRLRVVLLGGMPKRGSVRTATAKERPSRRNASTGGTQTGACDMPPEDTGLTVEEAAFIQVWCAVQSERLGLGLPPYDVAVLRMLDAYLPDVAVNFFLHEDAMACRPSGLAPRYHSVRSAWCMCWFWQASGRGSPLLLGRRIPRAGTRRTRGAVRPQQHA